ncbi:hypothetical protein [Desulfovibrio inopinatus]|uniref:hypothetical protein n=1 Tax=Desulfovibrio inopinatus TaxID=102109 RepID=UPI0003F5EE45|nr:hypothetical protein [Desulfovibrio inopinatus]
MQRFLNNVATTLFTDIDASTTSIAVSVGDGAKLPSLGAGEYALLTLVGYDPYPHESTWEIVKVLNVSGDLLTVERGYDGTTAKAWASGTVIQMRLTADSMEQLQNPFWR